MTILILGPHSIFRMGEALHFRFCTWIDHW